MTMCCLDCEDLKLLSVYNISKAGEWNINGGKCTGAILI